MEFDHGSAGRISVIRIDPRSKEIKRCIIDMPLVTGMDDMSRPQYHQLYELLDHPADHECLPILHPNLVDHYLVVAKNGRSTGAIPSLYTVKGTSRNPRFGPGVVLVIRDHKAYSADIPEPVGKDLITFL